eukprot:1981506-Pleurochrysis_carterae.AAC.1
MSSNTASSAAQTRALERGSLERTAAVRAFDCFDCAKERMASSTPQLSESLKNLSDGEHLDPKADALRVMFSLVCARPDEGSSASRRSADAEERRSADAEKLLASAIKCAAFCATARRAR